MVSLYEHEKNCPNASFAVFETYPIYRNDKGEKGYLLGTGDQFYDPKFLEGNNCPFCGMLIE